MRRSRLVGIAIARGTALEDVGDVHLRALHPDLTKQGVEQLAGCPDEGLALKVLVLTGRLPHEHEAGLRVTDTEDHLRPGIRKPALGADEGTRLQFLEDLDAVAHHHLLLHLRNWDHRSLMSQFSSQTGLSQSAEALTALSIAAAVAPNAASARVSTSASISPQETANTMSPSNLV